MESPKDFDFVGALRRRWVLVVVLTVVGAALGYGASTAMSPVYEGTASLLVGDFEDGSVSNNEVLAMQSLTATYADIARREPVLSEAAKDLPDTDWRQLRKTAHIRVPNESPQVVEITVEAGNRAWAAKAAGAIANSLVGFVDQTSGGNDFVSPQLERLEQAIEEDQQRVDDLQAQQKAEEGTPAPDALAREIERTQTQIALWQDNYASFKEIASTSSHVEIRQLGPAEADPTPVSPDLRFNTVMAGGFGFLLALAISYLLESRDRRRPDAPASTTLGFPIIVPPNLAHGTVPVPINGRSTQRVGPTGRTTDHHEGETQ